MSDIHPRSRRTFPLRLPDDLRTELEREAWDTHLSMNEIITEGLVLRLKTPDKAGIARFLAKLGYARRMQAGEPILEARHG